MPDAPRSDRPRVAVPITPELVVRQRLANGATVLVRESRAAAAITVRGYLRAGGACDPAGREGLALLTASLLTRGSASHTSESLGLALDSLGATLSVRADIEGVSFSVHCLAEDAGALLDLLAEVLTQPTFPSDETEKQRMKLITGIRESRYDTRAMADKTFRAAAYPDEHPYHRPLEGEEETVAPLVREDLAAFHRRWYHPKSAVFAIVGDVRAADVVARLDLALAGWRVGPPPDLPAVPASGPAPSVQRRTVALPGKTQADIVLGVPGFTRKSPDYYSATMADLILGRLGLMGRLGATLRDEEGLAYYVYSQAQAGFLAGPWAVRAGVNPKNVDRTVTGIVREIQGLQREPVRGDELRDAQEYVTGSLAVRLETDAGIAQALLDIELYDLGLDYLLRYPGLIRGVTPDQIGAAAQRYLRLDGYTVATAVPA
ncbi:MAG TPA: pitrilysin family protein [bacterium]|nr:pitrilysin family protein [bacterium]